MKAALPNLAYNQGLKRQTLHENVVTIMRRLARCIRSAYLLLYVWVRVLFKINII